MPAPDLETSAGPGVLDAPGPSTAELRGRFQRDVIWNLGSMGVLALSGIALVALTGRFYGEDGLGIFSLVMAHYVVFSQAAVGGVDRSVLRAVAEVAHDGMQPGDRERVTRRVLGALLPALALSTSFTTVFWLIRPLSASRLEIPEVAVGMAWATPGLFLFALNKVLLGATNGLRRMRAYAVLTALRYVLVLVGLLVALSLGWGAERLGFVFSFAEALLFCVLAVEVGRQLGPLRADGVLRWAREHLRYGVKSLVSGVLLELNARVDVYMLGMFLAKGPVGVYAYAATLAEGVFQLLVALQNNYNPLIARAVAGGAARPGPAQHAFHELVRRGRRRTYLWMLAACGAGVVGYPVYLMLVGPGFEASWLPFGILMAGMWLASGYMPFAQTLLMANRPGWHTLLMVGIVGANAIFNWFLIPRFGLEGAALATALSLVVSVFLLVGMVRWRVGLKL